MTHPDITRFAGEYRWLSNFWPAPIPYGNITFPTSEHAYQAFKSQDPEVWKIVAALPTPGMAKRYGSKIVLHPDWDSFKVETMRRILVIKFQNPELKAKLIATGDAQLVEGNTWGDLFWGVDTTMGVGSNQLGKLLMGIRDGLQGKSHG